jgi:hypothetical protein
VIYRHHPHETVGIERVVGQDEAVEGLLIARKGCSR